MSSNPGRVELGNFTVYLADEDVNKTSTQRRGTQVIYFYPKSYLNHKGYKPVSG